MIQGGEDNSWFRPLNPGDKILGAHRGNHSALNIKNPQPGYHYYYIRRHPSDVQRFMNAGWEFLGDEHEEDWGAKLPDHVQAQLDSVRAYQDVMPVRIRIEKYAEIQRQKQEDARVASAGADDEFLGKGDMQTERMQGASADNPVYYKRKDHLTHTEEY